MINKQTIISSFNEKGTLLKWLKAVESALDNASLSTVQLITVSDTQVRLSFVFADGSSVTSPTITLPQGPVGAQGPAGAQGPQGEQGERGPQGPQGPKGDDGTSVRILATEQDCTNLGDGYIDSDGHLQVLTSLDPRTFTDAGEIRGPQGEQGPQGPQGPQGETGAQGPQGETGATGATGPQGPAGQDGTDGTDGVGVPAGGSVGQVLTKISSTDYETAWATPSGGGMTNPMTAQGDVIIGGASGTPTRLPKGTAGQVLTMNSGATEPEWQTPSGGGGGGTQLYKHYIALGGGRKEKIILVSTSSSAITDFYYVPRPVSAYILLFGFLSTAVLELSAADADSGTLNYAYFYYNGTQTTIDFSQVTLASDTVTTL